MYKSISRIGLAVLCGALAVSSAQANSHNNNHSLVSANVNVGSPSHGQSSGSLLGVNANVLSNDSHGQSNGSLLGVSANVLSGSSHGSSGSLLNVNANVGGLLGVKANVGATTGETHCDFCGGNQGGVGQGGGW